MLDKSIQSSNAGLHRLWGTTRRSIHVARGPALGHSSVCPPQRTLGGVLGKPYGQSALRTVASNHLGGQQPAASTRYWGRDPAHRKLGPGSRLGFQSGFHRHWLEFVVDRSVASGLIKKRMGWS